MNKRELRRIGKPAFEAIKEMVDKMKDEDASELYREQAREEIMQDPLEVRVTAEGSSKQDLELTGFYILLATGGPAVRLVGKLTDHGDPYDVTLECQDWFTAWTEYPCDSDVLVQYAQCFYFGE